MPVSGVFKRRSIAWKLPVMFGGLLLAVTTALTGASYLQVRRSVRQVAEERLRNVAVQFGPMLGASGQQLKARLRTVAQDSAIRAFLATRAERLRPAALTAMQHVEGRETTLVAFELLDPSGARVAVAGRTGDRVVTPPLSEIQASGGAVDSGVAGAMRVFHGDTIVYPAIASVNDAGRRLGYLVQWRQAVPNPRTASTIERLIGSSAVMLVGNGAVWMGQHGLTTPPSVDVSRDSGVIMYERAGNGRRLAAVMHMAGTPWTLLIEFPYATVMAPARTFARRIALIGLVITAIGLASAMVFSRRIIGPLQQLTDAAGALSSADYSRRVLVSGNDEMTQLSTAFNAMAERVNDEVAARRQSEEQWRMLFESNPHPMWVFEAGSHRFLAVNKAAVDQYGYSEDEFLAMEVERISPLALPGPERSEQPAADSIDAGTHRRKDGSVLQVEITSHPLSFGGRAATLVLAQDVTEKSQLEAQLRQAQKMEAVGRLAGGVAHDFNNALAVIMTYSEMLAEAPANGTNAKHVEAIQRAAKHGHNLTRQLLAFSRRQVLQPVDLDANGAVAGVEEMLRRVIGEDIELTTRPGSGVGKIRIDPGQLEQVLMNLAVNARDAMPDGGSLIIATSRVDVDEHSARLHGLTKDGRFVMITVSDTGVGMSTETRAHIFEPFFTTKEEGKGTGLGLATVYGIVTQSGGQVSVYSEPGKGSVFRVYLPVVGDTPAFGTPAVAAVAAPKGAETVLLCEDDAAVREMVAEVLTIQGYSVLIAPTPADAIALAEHHGDQAIDMVVSDVVMPKMDGLTLVARLRTLRPGLRALLMSGYTGDVIFNKGVDGSRVPFIEKPFTVKSLASKVREVLDAP